MRLAWVRQRRYYSPLFEYCRTPRSGHVVERIQQYMESHGTVEAAEAKGPLATLTDSNLPAKSAGEKVGNAGAPVRLLLIIASGCRLSG